MELTEDQIEDQEQPKMYLINNTLFVFNHVISREMLQVDKNEVFNVVAPFLTEIQNETFLEYRKLKFVYAPLLSKVGVSAFNMCYAFSYLKADNIQ